MSVGVTTDALPKGWEWATICQIGKVVTGSTPSKSVAEYFGGIVPFFKPTDLNAGYNVRVSADTLSESGAMHARLFPSDTVLVTCIGATIGKTGIAREVGACNQQINAILTSSETTLPEWCYWAICSTIGQSQILDSASATTLPILNKSKFEQIRLPLAPLAEQRRIVAKIEELFAELDAGVSALKRVRANLKRYRASVLKAAVEGRLTADWRAAHPVTEPASALLARILTERRHKWESDQQTKFATSGKSPPKNWQAKYAEPSPPDTTALPKLPNGWTWASVEQVGTVQLGRQRSPQHHNGQHMRPYLRVANVFEDRIDIDDVMEMNFTPTEFEIYKLSHGDILLNEGQSMELVGRPAIYRNEVPGACFTNTLVRFRPFNGLDAEYAMKVFLAYLKNGRFQKIATITVNIAHLGAGRFAELEFPLPPLTEQEQIVAEVESRLSVAAAVEKQIEANLTRAARLRQAILKRAFAGKLVPQDPTDEPASVLLARLRGEQTTTVKPPRSRKGKR